MRISIRTKIILANLLVILPLLVGLNYLVITAFEQYNLQTVRSALMQSTRLTQLDLNRYLSQMPEPSGSDLHFLNMDMSQRFASPTQLFYSRNGRNVFVDSRTGDVTYDSTIAQDDEGISITMRDGTNYVMKNIQGTRVFEINFPIYQVDELVGSGRIIYSLEEEYELIGGLARIIAGLSGLVFLAIMGLLFVLTNRLVNPLIQLKNSIVAFDINHPGTLLEYEKADVEVFELARSFNVMAENIRDLVLKLKDERYKQKSFYDNMTHEFKTPLTTIIGCVDLAQRHDEPEKRKQCLTTIQSESERLLRLVNQLLHQSRINEYETKVNKEFLNVGEVVADAVRMLEYKGKKNKVALSVNLPNEPVFAYVDRDKLTELISNLVDNAIRHSGTSNVEAKLHVQGNEAVIDIIDFGHGFSDASSDQGEDHVFESQGIGLNICRRIVEQHGGSMYIMPQEVGTIVRVQLPMS